VLAAVVAFPRPELGVGLLCKEIAGLHKGFAQAELIVSNAARKAG